MIARAKIILEPPQKDSVPADIVELLEWLLFTFREPFGSRSEECWSGSVEVGGKEVGVDVTIRFPRQ